MIDKEAVLKDLGNVIQQREAVPGMPQEGPYPATIEELSDEIARFLMDLENTCARGVVPATINALLLMLRES